MAWKATGAPVVRRQRDRWVVRVDGIDTETGKHRPRQLGTYSSKRSAERRGASRDRGRQGRRRARDGGLGGAFVGDLADRPEPEGARAVRAGGAAYRRLGSARSRSTGSTVTTWRAGCRISLPADASADGASRSVEPCYAPRYETPSRRGASHRNPAARVPMPRQIAKPTRGRVADAWSEEEVEQFLARGRPPLGGWLPNRPPVRLTVRRRRRSSGTTWGRCSPPSPTGKP